MKQRGMQNRVTATGFGRYGERLFETYYACVMLRESARDGGSTSEHGCRAHGQPAHQLAPVEWLTSDRLHPKLLLAQSTEPSAATIVTQVSRSELQLATALQCSR
jgi:hypothetical protein